MNKLIFVLFLLLIGCPDFEEIQADIWVFNAEKKRIERKLNDGKTEFIRCETPAIENYRAIHRDDLETWIKQCSTRCDNDEF